MKNKWLSVASGAMMLVEGRLRALITNGAITGHRGHQRGYYGN